MLTTCASINTHAHVHVHACLLGSDVHVHVYTCTYMYLQQLCSSRPLLGVFLESMSEEIVEILRPLVLVSQPWGLEVTLGHEI